jgi:2-polyprenyl-6-methoxyphenol hydroxylase-like FAD-dependent oxidoreductase
MEKDIVIIGAGIGGLTLALMLEQAGRSVRVYEAAPEIKPLGVGISLLPHSTRQLASIGVLDALNKLAITTRETVFYTRFGEFVYREPVGRFADYEWPQLQAHRGDLQQVLYDAAKERIGKDRILTGWHCTGFAPEGAGAVAHFSDSQGNALPPQRGAAVIGCDGIHSVVRKQLHPQEGPPRYSGTNMWRGVTRRKPILTGASYIRIGWLAHGKLLVYPIRDNIDADGNQLINWVVNLETTKYEASKRNWNRPGKLEDFFGWFKDWHFDWLDVPDLIQNADVVLEYPMVDQDPVSRWSFGAVTLLGDAAHPMVPRGSNGAGQAILDARALTEALKAHADVESALKRYEAERLGKTTKIVLMNRDAPPDAILREVYLRSGDMPFGKLSDIISDEEMASMFEAYKKVAGYDKQSLKS